MKNLAISIIGGAGFIGQRLSRLIASEQSYEFHIYDKTAPKEFLDKSTLINIMDGEKLSEVLKKEEVIINLAAEHKDDVSPVSLYYDVNVEGARNVCQAAENNGVKKIIFTSSVAVYGLNKENPNEDFETDPFNHYGKSKLEAEEVYREWQQKAPAERSLVIIRPTVVFGENNRGNVYNLLKQIASGKFLRIGKGNNRKSMAYVGNVVSFLSYCLNADAGVHLYNYVDKPDLSTRELIQICDKSLGKNTPKVSIPYPIGMLAGYGFDVLSKVSGKSLPVSSVRIRKFCAKTAFDSTKAHSSGFKAPYSLQEGLEATLRHEFRDI
ncbi:MAG: N-acetyl-alpha-D-glucosaminyl-diphospho-ditrans,octacis-undecaprenol 4-epimerase [Roseivirga sp.]